MSKGYGFIEFTSYKEFQNALNQKDPIIFGKQKLVFNSAKNKYDNDEELVENIPLINANTNTTKVNTNPENLSYNSSDSFDTVTSTERISGVSNGSNNSDNIINHLKNRFKDNNIGFLGEKNKPNKKQIYKNEDNDDLLTLQIKYALSKMSAQFSVNNLNINKPLSSNFACEYYMSNINNNTNTNNSPNNKDKIVNNNEKLKIGNVSNNRSNYYYNKFSIVSKNPKY
jgi:hypothetical protein